MFDALIQILLLLVLGYVMVGLVVGLLFVLRGVGRVDPASAGSPFVFRLVILPGCVGLWPVVLGMWLRVRRPAIGGGA